MRIAKWSERYETHETRKLKHLQWVPVPNQHDGLSFRKIAAHKQSADIFAAWVLMLQVASKAKERGELMHKGKSMTAQDLSIMTGFPEHCFACAIPFLCEIGWIECGSDKAQSPGMSGESPGVPAESPGRREGKGMEGTEEKRTEENAHAHQWKPLTDSASTSDCLKFLMSGHVSFSKLNFPAQGQVASLLDQYTAIERATACNRLIQDYAGDAEMKYPPAMQLRYALEDIRSPRKKDGEPPQRKVKVL